jgi:hypothetical protein
MEVPITSQDLARIAGSVLKGLMVDANFICTRRVSSRHACPGVRTLGRS